VKYLLDNDLSPRFAAMLRALDVDVLALREKWAADTKDSVFLAELKGSEFDVFISKNIRQRTVPQERQLLQASGVTSLYLNPFWDGLGFWKQAALLTKNWPDIEDFCRIVAKGTCADLQQNGRIKTFHL
jgi:hypothetical protein